MRLKNVLKKKFQIEVELHVQKRNGKIQWRMYIKSNSAEKFYHLVEPYILPSLKYKLGLQPVGLARLGNTMPKE